MKEIKETREENQPLLMLLNKIDINITYLMLVPLKICRPLILQSADNIVISDYK